MVKPVRPSPRHKPLGVNELRSAAVTKPDQGDTSAGDASDQQRDLKRSLHAEFVAALASDQSLGDGDKAAIERYFAQAIDYASDEPASDGTGDDVNAWREAVGALQADGSVDEDSANRLIRELTRALQPLHQRESRMAIEFSRRMDRDGEESAVAWLCSQTGDQEGDADVAGTASSSGSEASPLRSEVIHSKSRRLRGPPGTG